MEQQVELDKRGRLSNMLGMELHWDHERVKLTQTRLIESLVNQYLKEIGGKNSLPSNPDAYQKADETDPRTETKRYQAIIYHRGTIVHRKNESSQNISPRKSPRKENQGCYGQIPQLGVTIFALNQKRSNYLVQSRRSELTIYTDETFCRSLRSRKPWGQERYTYQNHMVELVINSLHLVIIA